MFPASLLIAAALLAADSATVHARTLNISSTWFLPQEGFPVFYRYFRDRITWFEADAVCQFHHANLVTVDSSGQFDATRAYLKELDVLSNVWAGLKRGSAKDKWAWTDYKPLSPDGGYWLEQSAKSSGSLCAAIDPAADFRWHSLNCGGPEVASFICELPVPPWARQEDGCMLTALPSLSVTFLPEQAAVELSSDCGLDGTRRIACKGQANREEMVRQLSCDSEDQGNTSSSSSASVTTAEPPTRHRRDADDVASSSSSLLLGNTVAVGDDSTSTYEPAASTQAGASPPPLADSAPSSTETVAAPSSTSDQQADGIASTVGPAVVLSSQQSLLTPAATPIHSPTEAAGPVNATELAATDVATTTEDGRHNGTTPVANVRANSSVTTRAPVAVEWAPEEAMEEEPEEPVEPLEPEPEVPARPNRGRRLTRPQGHSFYPYFLNRVLG